MKRKSSNIFDHSDKSMRFSERSSIYTKRYYRSRGLRPSYLQPRTLEPENGNISVTPILAENLCLPAA